MMGKRMVCGAHLLSSLAPIFTQCLKRVRSFSVPRGQAVPSSLKNIYKELKNDVPGFVAPAHGFLEHWAKQGVLLLNTCLTVRARALRFALVAKLFTSSS